MAKGLYIYIFFCRVAVTGREMRDNCLLDHVLHHLLIVLAEQVAVTGRDIATSGLQLRPPITLQNIEVQLSFRNIVV